MNERWTGNLRNNLTLFGTINTQVSVRFRGPTQSAFGKRKAFGALNLGIGKDLFKDNATLNLNFSDVFNTQIFRWSGFTENIITNGEYQWKKPFYRLTFTYRFRQDKERQRREGGGDGYGNGEGFEL